MKLLHKHIEKDESGSARLIPEHPEDMWHVYNLIQKGDQLKASTVRGVKSESSTGSVTTDRVRIKLTISIEDVFFDVQAGALRINGRNIAENRVVSIGQYHTLDLEMNQPFTLIKSRWDFISLQRINDACDIARQADVAAVTMHEGLAVVCLVTQYMTVVRQRIEVPIPRKRRGSTTNYEKGVERFYEQIYRSIKQHIDFDIVKVVILGSPGFLRDQFFDYMMAQAVKSDDKIIMGNKAKFLRVHTSSGHKGALEEVMRDPQIKARLADTKSAQDAKTLDSFYQMLNNDPDRALYGYSDVRKAADNGAIGTLMVTDELFRAADIPTRRKYISLVEDSKATSADVLVFSSLHVSGEQLSQLTGVAAILNFPLIIESDRESENENSSSDEE
ncbi:Translation factor pelota [Coemansia sp. RSA 1813]|nr:Translation factor pelota [Coemansia sp. RSA 1646]KAJ1765155.1 Translation factor pelota [Coemansia sp. RSA 1843]KAJ2085575.1 Translation factor pelota [Coemansia sp. RSA 986]KAJ2211051.1 Translation factor pelota [Coemansia sp. RSA 487]KAJ2562942.1 Translation factor pelota [Coemansia sp. RSA 1813]